MAIHKPIILESGQTSLEDTSMEAALCHESRHVLNYKSWGGKWSPTFCLQPRGPCRTDDGVDGQRTWLFDCPPCNHKPQSFTAWGAVDYEGRSALTHTAGTRYPIWVNFSFWTKNRVMERGNNAAERLWRLDKLKTSFVKKNHLAGNELSGKRRR